MRRRLVLWLVPAAVLGAAACSDDDSGGAGSGGGTGGAFFSLPDAGSGPIDVPPTASFVMSELGGYALGDPVTENTPTGAGSQGEDAGAGCNVLVGVARDFKGAGESGGHPDFEAFGGSDATTDLVESRLGSDKKPVYASRCEAMPDDAACPFGQMTTSEGAFDQWYRSTDGVNQPFLVYFLFEQNGDVFTFASSSFFPLDGAGFGNTPEQSHNYHFTTELHTAFEYGGGEEFTFTGDDDVWVFVNGRLAIDLGGLHPEQSRTLDLDDAASSLEITPGNVYPLDLFHAERHTSESNFRVDTTLAFTNCGTIVPDLR